MTDTTQAFRAGIDAIIADNALTGAGFNDALQTVLTAAFTNADATAWRDAIAVEYARLGLINNGTYNNLRGLIINAADAAEAEALFLALSASIGPLPETAPAAASANLIDLRETRDTADAGIARLQVLIDAEPSAGGVGRLTKDILRNGKELLRQEKNRVRDAIQNLTGDADS